MKHEIIALILATCFLPVACLAQESKTEPIVTDRPDFTESTETVPRGRFQLEGGFTYVRDGSTRENGLGEWLLRAAVGAKTELRFGVPSYLGMRSADSSASGFEDASFGFKVKLVEGAEPYGLRRPHIAFIGATSVPTGSSAYRENRLQPEGKLCLGWDLSERLGLAANLNYAWRSEGGQQFDEYSGSVSFAYGLTERTGAYLEYFGFAPGNKGGPDTSYLNGGMTYLVTSDYQLDARGGVGLNGRSNDYFIGAGASRRF